MGLVAWMLIVMMMGAGIGRNSDTLELRELGGLVCCYIGVLLYSQISTLSYQYVAIIPYYYIILSLGHYTSKSLHYCIIIPSCYYIRMLVY